jgi:hypothetical protein
MLDIIKNEEIKMVDEGGVDLLIESYSNSARIVQIRGLTAENVISHDHTTSGDRSLVSTVVPLTSIPVTLTARNAAVGVRRGECYVKVSLRVEGVVVALLMAGYVAETNQLAYPNGKIEGSLEGPGLIRSITGTNPAV